MTFAEKDGGRGFGGERGSALLLVAALLVAALGLTAVLLALTSAASRATSSRIEDTRARWAARSAVEAVVDRIGRAIREGREPRGVDGRADSLASIVERDGPPLDLAAAPDGSFTARIVRRSEGPDGPIFEVAAYGKFGRSARGFSAVAEPAVARPFRAALFGDESATISGRGVIDAYDSSTGEDPVFGLDLVASNGAISIGNQSAKERNGESGGAEPEQRGASAGPDFTGAIYAPAADVHLSMQGGSNLVRAPAGTNLLVRGNVIAGPGAPVVRSGLVLIEGVIGCREGPLGLSPVPVGPFTGQPSPLAIAGGETALEGGRQSFSSIEVAAGGTLRIRGAVEIACAGDVRVESGGRIVVEDGASLRLAAAGSFSLKPGGAVLASRPPQAIFEVGADSVVESTKGIELHVRGLRGAIVARSVKVTGTAVDIRYDRALARTGVSTARTYRVAALLDVPAPSQPQ